MCIAHIVISPMKNVVIGCQFSGQVGWMDGNIVFFQCSYKNNDRLDKCLAGVRLDTYHIVRISILLMISH